MAVQLAAVSLELQTVGAESCVNPAGELQFLAKETLSCLRVNELLHTVCSVLMRFVVWKSHFIAYRNLYKELFPVQK